MLKNTNLKQIKKSLSFAPKKWTFLEGELDQMIIKIEGVQQDILNMDKISKSTVNLTELFEFHTRECQRLQDVIF